MIDPRDSSSSFGVLDFLVWDHDWNGYHYGGEKLEKGVKLMEDAGVGIVRMDFLWADIEPERGRFVFAKYDRLVDLLTRHGIKILGLLLYNPVWDAQPSIKPPNPELYVRYAQAVVGRYQDRVRNWEIWNEPDHEEYWLPQDGLKTYTELLKRVYPALKETDQTCRIHLGGLTRSLPGGLKSVYELGAGKCFDVVQVHPFLNPLMPDAIGGLRYLHDSIRQTMKTFGDGQKPVWFGEIGCPGMTDPKSAPDWWLGKNPMEIHQAAWVETLYTQALAWDGVEKIFWAFFRDTNQHFKTGVDSFGLIRQDFSPKPAYHAYRKIATESIGAQTPQKF